MIESKEYHSLEENRTYRKNIYSVGKLFWKAIENEWIEWLRDEGISINEHTILLTVYDMGELSITDIAKKGSMHISTALNFSRRLCERGYVVLKKNMTDKRITTLEITEAGREKIERLDMKWSESDSAIVSRAIQIEEILGVKPALKDLSILCNDH